MNTQPEALRLADELEVITRMGLATKLEGQSILELRRLQSVNAALLDALNRIASIELQMYGGDWDEIKEAKAIAKAAIAKATGETK